MVKEASFSLRFENVAQIRGEKTLFENLSFALKSGDMFWLQGDNGIGKTSILRLAAGLSSPTTGTIHWQNPESCQARHVLAYQGHQDALTPNLKLQDELKFWAELYDYDNGIENLLAKTGLQEQSNVPTQSLSAGQKRRAALARLLMSQKPLWIMDEPLAAMDATGKKLVYDLMEEHINVGGAILAASHSPASRIGHQTRKLKLQNLS